jgi:hypothetical protein
MPLELALRTKIQKALQGLSVLGLSQMVACDLYELFVLSIVIDAAKSQGPVTIDHRDIAGNVTTTLRCPTSPRAIGRGNYTYVRISFPGKKKLEAHLGVYVIGKSNVIHECDVLILPHEEAENCRRRTKPAPNPVYHPRAASVLSFTECKCYDSTNLTIGHGRAFLGLCQDIRPKGICAAFVSTKTHDQISKYLIAYKRIYGKGLVPANTQEIQWLQSKYADRFRSFKLGS